ncbi:hypothetical protein PGTUg99_037756 [Puccinia graminis f. sp. tritici]|uniref:Uncharacterized protein n=1 Tax=Puccinia graminis f. sp. tritici TaxID=56615 RepID=A0A5B0SNU1_PUCGR|nr:hypothetical protein PGTUg99_037756 [Puccinia graminis f. sp. tritici]
MSSTPSSPLDPHGPLTDQQSRDAYMNARRQLPREIPPATEQLRPARREQMDLSHLNLSDIPLPGATSHEPPMTPISRWLRNIEPLSPTTDLALPTESYSSPESDGSMDTASTSSVVADRNQQSPTRIIAFTREGLFIPEGISPTNARHRPADIHPIAGPSNARMVSPSPAANSDSDSPVLSSSPAKKSSNSAGMVSSSPTKKTVKVNGKGKAPGRSDGKKKHGVPTANLPRRPVVKIPKSRLRSGKGPASKS